MRMVHEIFHAMFQSKKVRFCWCVHIATESRCEVLKIVAILDSDGNYSTKPVIQGSSMCFLNFLKYLSNERCSHEGCLFKGCICWELIFLKFDFVFFFPIFLNDIFRDVICLFNTDVILTLNHVNVQEFRFLEFLVGIVKDSVKFLCESYK